jgi:hypothetical protein
MDYARVEAQREKGKVKGGGGINKSVEEQPLLFFFQVPMLLVYVARGEREENLEGGACL